MPQCAGIKRDGFRCSLSVPPGVAHCYNHDPARQEERRRNAARAGRCRSGREISDLKEQLDRLAEDVRDGTLEPKVGSVLNQIYNTKLRALEVERHVRETDELAAEIEELKREYGVA